MGIEKSREQLFSAWLLITLTSQEKLRFLGCLQVQFHKKNMKSMKEENSILPTALVLIYAGIRIIGTRPQYFHETQRVKSSQNEFKRVKTVIQVKAVIRVKTVI